MHNTFSARSIHSVMHVPGVVHKFCHCKSQPPVLIIHSSESTQTHPQILSCFLTINTYGTRYFMTRAIKNAPFKHRPFQTIKSTGSWERSYQGILSVSGLCDGLWAKAWHSRSQDAHVAPDTTCWKHCALLGDALVFPENVYFQLAYGFVHQWFY